MYLNINNLGTKVKCFGTKCKNSHVLPVPYNPSRARSMIWPGSQQTMGELLDQDKLSCKIREYIDGGNLPRNIDEAVAVKVADNGVFSKNDFVSL